MVLVSFDKTPSYTLLLFNTRETDVVIGAMSYPDNTPVKTASFGIFVIAFLYLSYKLAVTLKDFS